jgi:hypothetical protein
VRDGALLEAPRDGHADPPGAGAGNDVHQRGLGMLLIASIQLGGKRGD